MVECGAACKPKVGPQLRSCNVTLRVLSNAAAIMGIPTITDKSNETLEAAHAHIDDDRYDMVECGAAGKPKDGPLKSATTI